MRRVVQMLQRQNRAMLQMMSQKDVTIAEMVQERDGAVGRERAAIAAKVCVDGDGQRGRLNECDCESECVRRERWRRC